MAEKDTSQTKTDQGTNRTLPNKGDRQGDQKGSDFSGANDMAPDFVPKSKD